MAERRMFAKSVIESDLFLDMPLSAQSLYFHLGIRADDDGFVDSPKRIMRLTGATEDDLKIQIIKQFIIPFDTGIVVIRHWRTHNYIRSDRYKPTIYKSEKASLTIDSTGIYNVSGEGGTPLVDQMATVGSHVGCTGEGNKGKQSTGEQREGKSAITVPADHI